MKSFWDERYSLNEYVYGKEPNVFFKKELLKLVPGKILLPGEGEGRNAVFAASLGWNVTAFDQSVEAKKKSLKLASEINVELNYLINDFQNFYSEFDYYDCIALIFVHTPKDFRNIFHFKLIQYLKPGGNIILEAFSKEQINNSSGGPKNIEMLFSVDDLKKDFSSLNKINITEVEIDLNEGNFHKGKANVIRLVGQK